MPVASDGPWDDKIRDTVSRETPSSRQEVRSTFADRQLSHLVLRRPDRACRIASRGRGTGSDGN